MKKILILTCALALAGASTSAMAADDQGFLRVEAGRSDVDLDFDGLGRGSDEDNAWAVRGGYWFTPNFGAEVMYTTLYDESLGGFNFEVSGFGAGVVARKHFDGSDRGFFVSGRAGVTHMEGEVSTNFGSGEDSSNKFYAGAGVGYDFNELFGVSLNYDYTEADWDGVSAEAGALTVGAEVRF